MNIEEIKVAMKEGKKVRLPEWEGYWYEENGVVWVHHRDGTETPTPWWDTFKDRTDFEIME